MIKFKLNTMVEDSEISTPPIKEGSFSLSSPVPIHEAYVDCVESLYTGSQILKEAYVKPNFSGYYVINENVIHNVWDTVTKFLTKIIDSVKAFFGKIQAYFARLLGQTSRWYKTIRPRLEKARYYSGNVTVQMPTYRIENDNFPKLAQHLNKTATDLINFANQETATPFISKVFHLKRDVKTPTDMINSVKDTVIKYAKRRNTNRASIEDINEQIEDLKSATEKYNRVPDIDVTRAAASMMDDSCETADDCNNYIISHLYKNQEPSNQIIDAGNIELYGDVLSKNSSITKLIKSTINALHVNMNAAKAKWVARQREYTAYAEVYAELKQQRSMPSPDAKDKFKMKRKPLVDTSDVEVKRLAQAGATFISKYASYVCRLFSCVSKLILSQCNIFTSVFSKFCKDSMKAIMTLIKAAEADMKHATSATDSDV